jgi:hypothetical protein
MEMRLKSEFDYLVNKYPRVAFNCIDWGGGVRKGKDYLYATEGYITIPQNYNTEIFSKFKGFLTHNSKFYEMYKNKYNVILTNGCLNSHNYYALDNHVSYKDKIKGVVMMNNIYSTGNVGDIIHLREKYITELPVSPYLIKHTYGPVKYGGSMYQGSGYSATCNHANHEDNLRILSKYLFSFAMEPIYHEMWSWDYVTERLWNAFKAKTIPIYYGCYNIENIVPSDLYIDLRKYNGNLSSLAIDIVHNFPESRYNDMVNKAYEWYNKSRISNMPDLENILRQLP